MQIMNRFKCYRRPYRLLFESTYYGFPCHSIMAAKPPFRAMSMLSVGSIFVVDFTLWSFAWRAAFLPSACVVIHFAPSMAELMSKSRCSGALLPLIAPLYHFVPLHRAIATYSPSFPASAAPWHSFAFTFLFEHEM